MASKSLWFTVFSQESRARTLFSSDMSFLLTPAFSGGLTLTHRHDASWRNPVHPPKALAARYEPSSSRRFLSHRALAALRADSFLLSGESFSARALPLFEPPILPKSRATSLFSSSVM